MYYSDTSVRDVVVHYNLVRSHITLNDKSPAEVGGIDLDIENRWSDILDLIFTSLN